MVNCHIYDAFICEPPFSTSTEWYETANSPPHSSLCSTSIHLLLSFAIAVPRGKQWISFFIYELSQCVFRYLDEFWVTQCVFGLLGAVMICPTSGGHENRFTTPPACGRWISPSEGLIFISK